MDCKKEKIGIYSQLAKIRSELDWMSKEWENEQQGYSYFSDDQISRVFRWLFNKYGVAFLYSSKITGCREISPTRSGTKQFITDVLVEYKFVDIDDGSMIEWTACWSWNDTGDKWVYKAITWAVKYIFMKTFQISTGDDPEKDIVKDRKPKEEKKETAQKKSAKNPLDFDEENKDFDPWIFKDEFTEKDFENFKKAVQEWKFDIKDKTAGDVIEEIEKKYDVWARRKLEIQGFMKFQK